LSTAIHFRLVPRFSAAHRLIRRIVLPILLGAAVAQIACSAATAAQINVAPSWQQEYWARVDKHDWEAAIASAEQLVAAARPVTPESAARLTEALTLLGNAQLNKGNLVAAEASFTESLQIAERFNRRSSEALIDPLRGLGFTLAAEGKHDRAIPYMDRALLLSRRSAGLFDLSQQGLLRQLATSLMATGAAVDGERHMMYLRRLGEHAYGKGDPRLIPILCTVGDWYVEAARLDLARQNYRDAISIADHKLGKDSLGVVDPLRSLAASFPREIMLSFFGITTRSEKPMNLDSTANVMSDPMNPRYMSSEGERALLRALKILNANPDSPSQLQIATVIQTGDWFVMKLQPDKAMPFYEAAAKLMIQDAAQQGQPPPQSALSFPAQVFYPTPPIATRNLNRAPGDTEDHFVQVEFTVQPDSTVTDVQVTDKDANERQVSQVVDAMQAARYRPKFVDGKPVATTGIRFRQVFKVRADNSDTE